MRDPSAPVAVVIVNYNGARYTLDALAELDDIDDRTWRMVSVGRDECPGASRCPRGEDCLAERARARGAAADVLVVNLHLYAIDVMVDGEKVGEADDGCERGPQVVGHVRHELLNPMLNLVGRVHRLQRDDHAPVRRRGR